MANYVFRCKVTLPVDNLKNSGSIVWNFPEEVILINRTTACTSAVINLLNGTIVNLNIQLVYTYTK